jgi:ABC-type transport system involved in cytochrome c biogenesis ATPase subunit
LIVAKASEADGRYTDALRKFSPDDQGINPYSWNHANQAARDAAALLGLSADNIPKPGTDPRTVATWWTGFTPDQRDLLATAYPDQLADRARHLPSALSGGQRQRVAIARALSNEPLVVLADEPTGNLDSAATLDVLRLFEELRITGQTLVVVTHDARIAAVADRVIAMRDGAFADDNRLAGTAIGTVYDGRR